MCCRRVVAYGDHLMTTNAGERGAPPRRAAWAAYRGHLSASLGLADGSADRASTRTLMLRRPRSRRLLNHDEVAAVLRRIAMA